MWLQTYTGKRFDLLHPTPDMICLEDIARALGRKQRFGGHAHRTYSIAEHSINVMRCVNEPRSGWVRTVLQAALFHDAAEAYIGDIVTPLKRALNEQSDGLVTRMEHAVECAICEKFGIPIQAFKLPGKTLIKTADLSLLAAEIEALLDPIPPDEWAGDLWVSNGRQPWASFQWHGWDADEAAAQFTQAAADLGVTG